MSKRFEPVVLACEVMDALQSAEKRPGVLIIGCGPDPFVFEPGAVQPCQYRGDADLVRRPLERPDRICLVVGVAGAVGPREQKDFEYVPFSLRYVWEQDLAEIAHLLPGCIGFMKGGEFTPLAIRSPELKKDIRELASRMEAEEAREVRRRVPSGEVTRAINDVPISKRTSVAVWAAAALELLHERFGNRVSSKSSVSSVISKAIHSKTLYLYVPEAEPLRH